MKFQALLITSLFLASAGFAQNSKNSSSKNNNSDKGSSSSRPNYGQSSGSYKYNEPTYSKPSQPSKPSDSGSYSQPSNSYSSKPKQDYSYTAPKKDYSYTPPKQDYSYTPPKKDYSYTPPKNSGSSGGGSGSNSSKSDYGQSSGGYKYNDYTYTKPSQPAKPVTPVVPSVPKKEYSYTPPKKDYSYTPPKNNNSGNNNNSRPNYGQTTPDYKYNDYTYTRPSQPNNNNNQNQRPNQNNNSHYGNKNGTVPLKDLRPGDTRIRADGTHDKVHKDGKGYTHTFVDKNGNTRKESIRYNKNGQEVKISDTERRPNGDVITKYRSGVSEVRTRDGLRYQQDRYGNHIYQEQKSTWNNRPVIQRHYNNYNYTTVYVQNYYYGTPVYFYRPSHFDYNYYSYSLTTWRRPLNYTWGWTYYSYYPEYNYYYRPYPVYYSPAYWLTDYLIMSLIQANYDRIAADNERYAYEARQQSMIDETIKEEVRRQVEQALRDQQMAVQNQSVMEPSRILTQGRLMVVHTDLIVEDQNGQQCQLDEGDVIRILNQPSNLTPIAELKVVSAKGSSCSVGTVLSLSAQNLIEMENEFQTRIQQGMSEMQTKNLGNN